MSATCPRLAGPWGPSRRGLAGGREQAGLSCSGQVRDQTARSGQWD